nr:DUF1904 family protein [uncultured Niameybacter sp.]
MPMLRIRGVQMSKIKQVSRELVDELATIIGCPKDYLTLECMHTTFISEGKEVDAPALVEVAWFDRGQEVQDQVAQCITKYLGEGLPCFEVYFITLKENQYYENGQHF